MSTSVRVTVAECNRMIEDSIRVTVAECNRMIAFPTAILFEES